MSDTQPNLNPGCKKPVCVQRLIITSSLSYNLSWFLLVAYSEQQLTLHVIQGDVSLEYIVNVIIYAPLFT